MLRCARVSGVVSTGKSRTNVGAHSLSPTVCSQSSSTIFPWPYPRSRGISTPSRSANSRSRVDRRLRGDLFAERLGQRRIHLDRRPFAVEIVRRAIRQWHRPGTDGLVGDFLNNFAGHPRGIVIRPVRLDMSPASRIPVNAWNPRLRFGTRDSARKPSPNHRPRSASGTVPVRCAGTGRRRAHWNA